MRSIPLEALLVPREAAAAGTSAVGAAAASAAEVIARKDAWFRSRWGASGCERSRAGV